MQAILYLFVFSLIYSYGSTSDELTAFDITIKTPENATTPSQIPYVCK
jgi:hypothetical protein